MPQIEAYIIEERPDGSKRIVYEPGHFDARDAERIAQRAAQRERGVTYTVVVPKGSWLFEDD